MNDINRDLNVMAKPHEDQMSLIDLLNAPLGHGGKRAGAGRKKGMKTTTIRVPVDIIPEIQELIVNYKNTKRT